MARVLVAILVYGGPSFVPRCLESARRVRDLSENEVELLVLDDCSPDADWSKSVAALCQAHGIGYYRSPRNLGIPRNMNLAAHYARSRHVDHLVISNSDVIHPASLVDGLVEAARPGVASVTAWSNHASVYSLPSSAPELLSDQSTVDWLSATLAGALDAHGVEVPTAVGFCMLIPIHVLEDVGLFDPVFGRGYCEEVDWCQRARSLGYRHVLAPSVFVFHEGHGSTRGTGMLTPGQMTVNAHERIIDLRYPHYRTTVESFLDSGTLDELRVAGCQEVIVAAARRYGYRIEATALERPRPMATEVLVTVHPETGQAVSSWSGFRWNGPDGAEIVTALRRLAGRDPEAVVCHDRGAAADRIVASCPAGVPVTRELSYRELV